MKQVKKIFAIFFLISYLMYSGDAIFKGMGHVIRAGAASFPSSEAMAYAADSAAGAYLPSRAEALENYAILMKALNKTETGGFDVIAAKDDKFIHLPKSEWTRTEIENYALKLNELNTVIDAIDLNTQVIYISSQPQIINGYTEPLREYPLPDQSRLTETMLYYLRSYNVEFIDSYQVLENTTLNHSEYVYKTDTKWTTQASFMIAKALIGRLDDRFNEGIDPTGTLFDIKSFDFQTYKGLLLGNVGMRAGENFTGREDFTIITPSYNTNLSYQGTDEEADKAGSFYETLINLDHLQPADPYTYSAYSAYLNGGADYHRVITNSRQPLAPKALFIHDSMALPLAAFSSLGFSETHMYWPGISPDNSFNVLSYVIEHDIDYVFFVSECDPYALKSIFEVVMR